MNLISDLPEVFDTFAQQRKNSFLTVKEFKERGIPIIGSYCSYFPKEIAMAAGAAPVSLCSTSGETIPEAEKDLPRNLCPLIKSSYGFAKTQKCPYFYFSDLVVGETTCDGKKKMYEMLSDLKDVHVMRLPNKQDEEALDAWTNEIIRLKNAVEERFGVTITEEKLREAVHINNQANASLESLCTVMEHDPCPISGHDLFKVLNGSQFKFDRKALAAEITALSQKIEADYSSGRMLDKRPRILITGCPMGGATEKVIEAVEQNGGIVVGFENCSGEKNFGIQVDEKAADIYRALARRYLDIGCSVMSPNPHRLDTLGRMIDQYHADGVLEMDLQTCLTYEVESAKIRRFVTKEKGIPYLQVETDYSQSDIGQLNTRIAAFIEMI